MSDIYFKCNGCQTQLMVDDVWARHRVACPQCDSALTIPNQYALHTCPSCLKTVPVDPALRGTRLRCPYCTNTIIPPLPINQTNVMFFLCHHCEQRIQASMIKMGQYLSCPQCHRLLWGPELEEFADYRVEERWVAGNPTPRVGVGGHMGNVKL